MKNLLIIYPHWHPANLAGVHRPRLIGNFLPEFGWHPIVLTVNPEYFEEKPDPYFELTFRKHFEVVRVNAFPITRPRLIGDIGLRAFFYLYREALKIIKVRKPAFIWIPIPSFYTALLGRLLNEKTGLPYGIDYIDPWVRSLAHFQKRFSRFWWSIQLAKILEPIAVKKASLISGVSTSYYQAVLDRNFPKKNITHVGMPYGFDPDDHTIQLSNVTLPWRLDPIGTKPWVYAGAFLPKSHFFVDCFFEAISIMRSAGTWDSKVRLYFLGTGKYQGESIADYAQKHKITDIVTENRRRYPYLQVLYFLSQASRVMVIGSTEKHYTASKTFQALLSKKAVWAMFHKDSSALQFMRQAEAGAYTICYEEGDTQEQLISKIRPQLKRFLTLSEGWFPDYSALEPYSARTSARSLITAIDKTLSE